jgi:YbbR domain-containing protein
MKSLDNFSDLEKELNKFVREKFIAPSSGSIHQFISHNFVLKTAAIFSAGLLWFFSAYQAGIIKKSYTIPVTFTHTPPDTLIQSFSPKEVTLTVSGRGEISFNQISRDSFAIEIDTSSIHNGVNQLNLSPSDIKQPLNLLVTSVEPSALLLTANKYYSAPVGIQVQTRGQLAKSYHIQNITITPEQLDIWIPENATPPASISTEPIDISGKKESFVTSVNLILPPDAKFLKPEDITASVALTIAK